MYKNYQSSSHIIVEQTFRKLVRRWGTLWKPIHYSLPLATQCVRVCAKINILLIDQKSSVPLGLLSENAPGGSCEANFQDRCDADER